jgi:hypothetical protein
MNSTINIATVRPNVFKLTIKNAFKLKAAHIRGNMAVQVSLKSGSANLTFSLLLSHLALDHSWIFDHLVLYYFQVSDWVPSPLYFRSFQILGC